MPRAVVKSGLPNSQPFPEQIDVVGANVATTAFRHVATVERNTQAVADDWGNPLPPVWATHLTDVACLAFVRPVGSEQSREIIDATKTAVVDDRRVLVALDTDVTVADRLGDVTDADGAVVFDGPMGISAVMRRVSYLELAVEQIA